MKSRVHIALATAALLSLVQGASAQGIGVGGGVAGSAGVINSPLAQPSAPAVGGVVTSPGLSTAPSGVTTGAVAPGTVGTRAPSGLPGDNPEAPGFPGRVGR